MAKDNIIGLAMELDVADLKTGIKQVNDLIKKSKDQFNLATAGMDKWTKSSEGLNAKLTQLNSQLDLQKKKVSGYKAEIERISKLEGDHSQELENLKSKLQKAQIEVKKTEQAISHYSSELDDVTKEEKKSSSELGKLTKKISEQKNELEDLSDEYKNTVLTYGKNSEEAKKLAKQISSLTKELNANENQVEEADKAYDELNTGMNSVSDIGDKVKSGLIGIGASLGALASAFFATAESSRELRTNMGKLETAFTTSGLSAEQAKNTYNELFSIVADEGKATEASAMIAKMATTQEDLTQWVDICTGAYATFGDSLPIEGLAEASNETAKTGHLTGVLADALNWAGVNEDEFQLSLDKANSEQERQKIIMNTLTGLYSKASDSYKEINKDVIASNEAQVKLNQAMAEVGKVAEPVITKLKEIGAEVIGKLAPKLPDIINKVEKFSKVILSIAPAIGGAIVAFKSYEAITKLSTIAQTALNVAMKANPIGLVVTAVGLLVGAFTSLWNNCEGFRNFWIDMWNKIKEFTKNTIDFVKNLITETLPEAFGKVKDIGKNILSGLWEGIKGSFNWLKDKVYSAGESVLGWFKDVFGIHSPSKEMKKQGEYLDEGLAEGIEKNSGDVHEAIEDVSEDLKETVENTELTISPINTENADLSFDEFVNNLKVKLDEVHFDHWIGQVASVFTTITDSISKVNEQQTKEIDYKLKQSNKLKDVEIANAKEKTAKEIELLKKQYDEGKISYEDFTKKKETLEKNLSGTIETLTKEKAKAEQDALKQKDKLARQQFNAQKANQIAQAVIDGAKAILLGFAQLGPVAGGINAGIQAGITTAQIAVISKQKYIPMLAKGGVVDKSTLAMIGESGKEAVMPLENNTGWIKELAMKLNSFMNKDFGFNKFSSGLRTPKIINNYSQTINAPRIPSRIELYRDTKNLLSLKGV